MSRSASKGPYIDQRLLKKVLKQKEGASRDAIKTWARACQIPPEFVGHTIAVHNGKNFIGVKVTESMVGHRLGEFSPTRVFRGHGRVVAREVSKTLSIMLYAAESKNVRMSARKVRLVTDAIRGKKLPFALSRLEVLNKRASMPVRKTIESAIANAVNNFKAKKEDLILKSIIVNEGTMLKRFHYAGRGRIRPYKRRVSHIKVILEGKEVMKTEIKKEGGKE